MSLERYFAICQPLRSRSWQTLSHAYRVIGVVWALSGVTMVPIAVYHRLLTMPSGGHKCFEKWDSVRAERAYTLLLDGALLVLPLLLMLGAYGRIAHTLWQGIQLELRGAQELARLNMTCVREDEDVEPDDDSNKYRNGTSTPSGECRRSQDGGASVKRRFDVRLQHVRHTNTEKSLQAKRRVIIMLCVVVMEFFVCWTPLFLVQTWSVFERESARYYVSPLTMNLVHLLSYVSACCNPITYCFMSRKLRAAFLAAFVCWPCAGRRRDLRRAYAAADQSFGGTSQRTGNNAPASPTALLLRRAAAPGAGGGGGGGEVVVGRAHKGLHYINMYALTDRGGDGSSRGAQALLPHNHNHKGCHGNGMLS